VRGLGEGGMAMGGVVGGGREKARWGDGGGGVGEGG